MGRVVHDVGLVVQGQENPICWVAACAMAKDYATGISRGVGQFAGGADPSSSSIPNLYTGEWGNCARAMQNWGFSTYAVSEFCDGVMQAEDLLKILQLGPAVLLHTCESFPYGGNWEAPPPDAAHAVLLTCIDTDNNAVAFNNPWGDKNRTADLQTILWKINADQILGDTIGLYNG